MQSHPCRFFRKQSQERTRNLRRKGQVREAQEGGSWAQRDRGGSGFLSWLHLGLLTFPVTFSQRLGTMHLGPGCPKFLTSFYVNKVGQRVSNFLRLLNQSLNESQSSFVTQLIELHPSACQRLLFSGVGMGGGGMPNCFLRGWVSGLC